MLLYIRKGLKTRKDFLFFFSYGACPIAAPCLYYKAIFSHATNYFLRVNPNTVRRLAA
jgi:hypothetical protein